MSKEDHSQDGLGQQRRDIQGQLHSQLFDDAYDIADCGVLLECVNESVLTRMVIAHTVGPVAFA